MASLKDLAESRAALLNFDPRKIQIKNGLNARDTGSDENRAHIEALAISIARDGVRVPLVIFQEGESVFVADGHCRLAATMLAIERGADILTVPCIPEPRGTNDVDRTLSQNIYNSGKRLSALEEGVNYRKALALGATEQQIAEKVSRSITHVKQAIELQSLPEAVKTLVRDGSVSASLASKTVKQEGGERAATKLKDAVQSNNDAGKKRVLPKQIAPTSLSLKDGLRDMVSSGRLTRAMIPDDFDWLCETLGSAKHPHRENTWSIEP